MNFFRTSFWAALSTGVTMICGLITTKYIAVMIGPQGMAYVGQFSNSVVLLSLLASVACTSGVVKYVAEHDELSERKNVIAAAVSLVLLGTMIISIICIVFSKFFAGLVFKDERFFDVFIYFGFLVIFPTINGLASSVLNGANQVKTMALLNILTAIVNLVFVVSAARFIGLKGVLLANAVAAAVVCGVYLCVLKKKGFIPSTVSVRRPDRKVVQLLLGFSVMNVVSGILAPMLQLFIRSKLLHNYNAATAGLWQANIRLSDYYLNFIYTVMGVYYLPKISSLKEKTEIKKEIGLGYLRIMPIVIITTLLIWLFRDYIIKYLLTEQFREMLTILKWQLIGDVIKISSWILGYVVVAKAMRRIFVATEVIFSVSLVVISYWLVNQFGLIGTVYGFTINYTLYLFTMVFLLRKYLR